MKNIKNRQNSLGPQGRYPEKDTNLSFEGRDDDSTLAKTPLPDCDLAIPLAYHDLAKPKSFKNFLQNLAACHEHSFSEQKQSDPSASYHFFIEYIQLLISDENSRSRVQVELDEATNFLKVQMLSKDQQISDLQNKQEIQAVLIESLLQQLRNSKKEAMQLFEAQS